MKPEHFGGCSQSVHSGVAPDCAAAMMRPMVPPTVAQTNIEVDSARFNKKQLKDLVTQLKAHGIANIDELEEPSRPSYMSSSGGSANVFYILKS